MEGAPFREGEFSAQDGVALYYRDYGDPRSPMMPVLCLGGLTRNSKDFHRLASTLSAGGGRRVVCPDYRGRGRSEWDPDWRNYHPATYLGDIRHLLAVTGLHRVAVVGTSLGGVLAMAMGAAMPTAVAGVVLNDVGPEIDPADLRPIIDYMTDTRPLPSWEAAVERLKRTFPDFPAKTEKDWLVIARATYREDGRGRVRMDWDPDIVKPLLEGGPGKIDLWPLYRSLARVPMLSVRGERSRVLPEAVQARMAEVHPGLACAMVSDVGHAPSLAEPEVRGALEAFLAALPRA